MGSHVHKTYTYETEKYIDVVYSIYAVAIGQTEEANMISLKVYLYVCMRRRVGFMYGAIDRTDRETIR